MQARPQPRRLVSQAGADGLMMCRDVGWLERPGGRKSHCAVQVAVPCVSAMIGKRLGERWCRHPTDTSSVTNPFQGIPNNGERVTSLTSRGWGTEWNVPSQVLKNLRGLHFLAWIYVDKSEDGVGVFSAHDSSTESLSNELSRYCKSCISHWFLFLAYTLYFNLLPKT